MYSVIAIIAGLLLVGGCVVAVPAQEASPPTVSRYLARLLQEDLARCRGTLAHVLVQRDKLAEAEKLNNQAKKLDKE